jgi:hypothetical protein
MKAIANWLPAVKRNDLSLNVFGGETDRLGGDKRSSGADEGAEEEVME